MTVRENNAIERMWYIRLLQEKPVKWLLTVNLVNTQYYLKVKLLNSQHSVHIRDLQCKFIITSICTNRESCPTSVSHEKEMTLNGRITSARKPLGIRLRTHCLPSRTLLRVVL